ncbi:small subunit rRNA maturation protein TSR4 [Sporobolomyces salmoneus]|uniref:small subunit rRNA maturation protein TSR4 n=1 Tax=Sporobolomyces salmoneus TaxID=183962 RepID=UPI00316AFE9C
MPAPQTNFLANTDKSGYDPATLSDDDEDDKYSQSSRSTWASSSDATILGFADGFLGQGEQEALDWRVSRIGGLPNSMPLLTQIYCPLESSSLERVVYVFACPRTACRKKDGSIRAFRANQIWKESPEEKARIEEEKKENQPKPVAVDLGGLVFGGASTPAPSSVSSNPFAATSNPFAAKPSAHPFAPTSSSSNPFAPTPPPAPVQAAAPPPLVEEVETLSTGDVSSTWTSGPSYPSQYITTSYEPSSPKISSKSLPPLSSLTISDNVQAQEDEEDRYDTRKEGKGSGGRTKKGSGGGKGRADGSGGKSGGAGSGGSTSGPGEGYEVQRVKGVDQVFLRFQERVSREGSQVVRYDHNSQPLAFSASSSAYKTLYPSSSSHDELGAFKPSRLPTCRSCQQCSVFEYQLMPNLISVLNRTEGLNGTSAYGDTGKKGEKEEGLDWATVWVFTCGAECVDSRGNREKESWKEERVMVEWEE